MLPVESYSGILIEAVTDVPRYNVYLGIEG